jgi:pyrroloquinoline-quinone synthase
MPNSFDSIFDDLHLLKHSFYQAWMQGTLSPETLKDYAKQYYYHVDRFPRYLSAIHSNCDDSSWRNELLSNLNDEEGWDGRTSHPELWLQFAEGLGVKREEAVSESPRPAIQNVSETFFRYAKRSFHEGLGALYAYESQVPEIAKSKIDGLKKNYGIEDSRTLKFFEVHQEADVEHRKVVLKMIENLPDDQKQEAASAARHAAQALWNFLTDVQEKATVLNLVPECTSFGTSPGLGS